MPKRFSQLPNRTEVSPVPSVESVRFVCTYGTDPYTKTINVPGSDILNIPNTNLTTHINTSATSTDQGHVYLATSETDSRANAVPTIAQFKALMDRVAALENA